MLTLLSYVLTAECAKRLLELLQSSGVSQADRLLDCVEDFFFLFTQLSYTLAT